MSLSDVEWYGVVGCGATVGAFLLFILAKFVTSDCDMVLARRAYLPANCFEGSVVWITGASSGIGEFLAYEMAQRKATLVLSARRQAELERVAAKAKQYGAADVLVLPLDVMKFDTHAGAVQRVLSKFGRIDTRALAEETALDVDRAVIELNTLGPISLTKAVLPHMLKRRSGHIVVTSSVAGLVGAPVSTAYSAAKHAVQGFYKGLRPEVCDRNVHVTLVCPGPVVSNIQEHSFTGTVGKKFGGAVHDGSARCAFLTACAILHRLPEVWISLHPVLLFVYVSQYFPQWATQLSLTVGAQRVANFRAGVTGYVFTAAGARRMKRKAQ